jgi:hypothetical protein
MYRQGFGDCFLLKLQDDGSADAHYVLIDCGLAAGAPSQMPAVIANLAATTNHLDAVVATHDHYDHLSGFNDMSKFGGVTIDKLWLAWTEDDTDPLAQAIKSARGTQMAALSALAGGAKAVGLTVPIEVQTALEFADYGSAAGLAAAAGAASSQSRGKLGPVMPPSQGMSNIRAAAANNIVFCNPGQEPLTIPGVQGARFFVLGPPRDESVFTLPKPEDTDANQIYALTAALGADASFLPAGLASASGMQADGQWDEARELAYPFDRTYRQPLAVEDGKTMPTPADDPQAADFLRSHYCGDADDWRRIDSDWMSTAGLLAMRIDDDTNLTSLALALELVETGKVLLFPGDAQIESWVTWPDCTSSFEEGGAQVERSGKDLLGQVVFYKVGHHGSHNGTAKDSGLELMGSPDLVAMIPVDPRYNMVSSGKWQMPAPAMLPHLEEKAQHRVVQANPDGDIAAGGADPISANLDDSIGPDRH